MVPNERQNDVLQNMATEIYM